MPITHDGVEKSFQFEVLPTDAGVDIILGLPSLPALGIRVEGIARQFPNTFWSLNRTLPMIGEDPTRCVDSWHPLADHPDVPNQVVDGSHSDSSFMKRIEPLVNSKFLPTARE